MSLTSASGLIEVLLLTVDGVLWPIELVLRGIEAFGLIGGEGSVKPRKKRRNRLLIN